MRNMYADLNVISRKGDLDDGGLNPGSKHREYPVVHPQCLTNSIHLEGPSTLGVCVLARELVRWVLAAVSVHTMTRDLSLQD